jgi:hypothetical protein
MWSKAGGARAPCGSRGLGAAAVGLACSLFASTAFAEPAAKADCASAYEKSQELRNAGKMRQSEGTLVKCADPTCPGFIQADCTQWLVEVQRDMPTVVIAARDERGSETEHVRVSIDGEVWLTELVKPIEQKVLVRQGQKGRAIEVSFAPGGGDIPAESPYADFPREKEPPNVPPEPRPSGEFLRPYAYVAGGVGLAGVVTFAVLGATGKSRENELRRRCVDQCDPGDVDSIRTKYVVADVALGVGIAGLGSAVALFLLSQPKHDTTTGMRRSRTVFDVRPAPGSAVVTFSGAF